VQFTSRRADAAPLAVALLLALGASTAPAQQAPPRPSYLPDLGQAPPPLRGAQPPAVSPFRGADAQLPTLPAGPQFLPTPAAPADPPVWRAAFADGVPGVSEAAPYPIQLEPPDMERVAVSLQSDEAWRERVRQEHRERKQMERVTFPESPVLSTDTYRGRSWEPSKLMVEPNYVVYRRLYFHQLNFERYGWDLGPITPPLSAVAFLADFLALPYHLGTDPCRCIDSNAGYCLPGDPVPLLLYPVELSLTGAVAEAGAVLALVALFP
jgi:hypothetical protein